jgi:hypothetical protein
MRSLGSALLATALLFAATAPVHAAPTEDPLADKVNEAIRLGVSYLRDQGPNGTWEVDPAIQLAGGKGGQTALALLALLNCGVPPEDPLVKKGLEYLRSTDTDKTYALSLQTMVFILAGQDGDKQRIQQNVDKLLQSRMKDGWTYGMPDPKSLRVADNSNTQYALLALHEAIQAGYKVDGDVLKEIQEFYKTTQKNGAWGYSQAAPGARFTMTTAGLCGLYITGMDIGTSLQKLNENTGVADNCGKYTDNPNVTQAIAWLSNRFPSRLNEASIERQGLRPIFYALYGLERAGRLSGQRYLGEQDWYRIGCEYLVAEQKTDGSWKGETGADKAWPVYSTSFALLFLSKGRTPVLVTKLAFGQPTYNGWNNKHNDARNVTEFASRQLFKRQPMAWQVFDVRNKTADGKAARRDLAAELLQSPLVYFNGHDEVPSGKEEEILQEYIENGGILFAEACCGRELFDRNFRALMARMFPNSELMELPATHPVWNAAGKFPMVPGKPFKLYGISQGCKTVVIYSPQPITGYWEANQFEKGNGKSAFELGANIIAYATGLEPPKQKGKEAPIFRSDGKADIKRGYFKVAQLVRNVVKGPPAPNAMRNLMAESRKLGLDVMLETKRINPTSEADVMSYNFFYMHDRDDFKYTTADLKALRFKLEDGGTLLADACCGSPDFDKAFHKFIDELFDHKLKLEDILPEKEDLLFSAKLNPEKIDGGNIRLRRQAGKPYANTAPELQGVKFEGRWIVIYSKYDLGCALENKTSPDCVGYDHDSAVKLARAAVLYHLNR